MSIFEAALLGIIQGLTEFLPVSSSGHLVLAQEILGVQMPGITFEVLSHLGTLLAVVVYFRSRIVRLATSLIRKDLKSERRTVLLLAAATVPAGAAGLLLNSFVKQAFSSPVAASGGLIATGLILLSTRFVRAGDRPVGWKSAILMGIGQMIALLPGISRSGSTIAFGMLARVKPSVAAEFSFLLIIPVILGATVLELGELATIDSSLLLAYFVAVVLAFLSGLVAVHTVLAVVRRGKFVYFAYYCFAVGGLGLYLFI